LGRSATAKKKNCRYSQNDSNSKSADTLLAMSKDFLSGLDTS